MNENNYEFLDIDFEEIILLHTLMYEAVHNMGGDDNDYDDCLDILGI